MSLRGLSDSFMGKDKLSSQVHNYQFLICCDH